MEVKEFGTLTSDLLTLSDWLAEAWKALVSTRLPECCQKDTGVGIWH
jgi:hypothetical protein